MDRRAFLEADQVVAETIPAANDPGTVSNEASLRLLVDGIQDYAIVLIDPTGRVATWSRGAQHLNGYSEAEILGRSMTVFYPPEAVAAGLPERLLAECLMHGRAEEEGWRVRKDHSRFFAEVVVRPVHNSLGALAGFTMVTRNISGRKQAELSLRLSEARYRLLTEHSTDVIMWIGPDGTSLHVSAACRHLFGYEPEELIGRPIGYLVHADDRVAIAQSESVCRNVPEDEAVAATFRCVCKNGSIIWVETIHRRLPDDRGCIVTIRDISEHKRIKDELVEANRHLQELARRDGLTGLSNRRLFDEAMQTELLRAARDGRPLSLMLIDVDHFKQFNDRYGHPAGDDCLRAVAQALREVLCRPGDLVARYGGEEFAVLLPNTAEAGAAAVVQRLVGTVRGLKIAHDNSRALIVTISAGVTTFFPGRDPAEPKELIKLADAKLYQAKRTGRNRFCA
jgi:diguanylate cyclase (GGDEF)-like protein/PAS domain S-box-containing protein